MAAGVLRYWRSHRRVSGATALVPYRINSQIDLDTYANNHNARQKCYDPSQPDQLACLPLGRCLIIFYRIMQCSSRAAT